MLSCKTSVIHERSEIIPIKQNLSTSMKEESPKGEYSLTQNFFDPSKSSPPNEFMNKLKKRMQVYDHFCFNYLDVDVDVDVDVDKKDDSFVKE
jgi:uncharacterized protein with NRDE domain